MINDYYDTVKEINELIDSIGVNEFESIDELIEFLDTTYKRCEYDIPRDMITSIIKQKYSVKFVINDITNINLYESILDKKVDYIKNVPQPEQRTKAWFDMRNNMITASSAATALDENPYEKVDAFVMEKVFGREFMDNEFVHHGKKYENIATKLYEHLKNAQVDEYGLIQHPNISFLGASPDGICSKYTLDGDVNLKNYGRMLEIKCPFVRKIKMKGEIDGEICPHYYWIQIQLQLECCDLEYCDFWQCEIKEYEDVEKWMLPVKMNHRCEQDEISEIKEEWTYGFVVQYKMDNYVKRNNTDKEVFCSKYLYPKNLLGNHHEKVIMANEMKKEEIPGFTFDKILYWRIVNSHCCEVKRQRKWFEDKYPIFKDVWNRIEYLRKDTEAANIFREKVLKKKDENKMKYGKKKDVFVTDTSEKVEKTNKVSSWF